MDELSAAVTVTQLAHWRDTAVERAYRLVSGEVTRRLSSGEDPGSERLRELRVDAELFGIELVRRGLL